MERDKFRVFLSLTRARIRSRFFSISIIYKQNKLIQNKFWSSSASSPATIPLLRDSPSYNTKPPTQLGATGSTSTTPSVSVLNNHKFLIKIRIGHVIFRFFFSCLLGHILRAAAIPRYGLRQPLMHHGWPAWADL